MDQTAVECRVRTDNAPANFTAINEAIEVALHPQLTLPGTHGDDDELRTAGIDPLDESARLTSSTEQNPGFNVPTLRS